MALPVPNLDDRTFQDLVREARAMIPRYCPEWTDHNLSDPGITLIELFAWMVEVLLYRLNKVPVKNYIKFLELIGVRLAPANPATVDVTFRLSAPQESPVLIPVGTEVATVRTETEEAITFTTDADLRIEPPALSYFLITRDDVNFVDFLDELDKGRPIDLFRETPQEGNAFYVGYSESLAGRVLALTMECVIAKGVGVNPNDPPLAWEYWDETVQGWQAFDRRPEAVAWLEQDGTRALNYTGDIVLHPPRSFAATEVNLIKAYWVRCRVATPRPGQPTYLATPAVLGIASGCLGGRVAASHGVRVRNELLGESDGNGGQRFRLENSPILAPGRGEAVEVQQEDDGYERWEEVADFSQSGPEDRHVVCDTQEGEVQFGPSIRQPDGSVRQYGAVPPKGRTIRMSAYRYGGGSAGNVGRNTLTVLKSSIPYVASVANRRPATGGADPESLENAMMRGPQKFRTLNRAVTEADFEYLAKEASPSVARAKCVQPRETGAEDGPAPGVVFLHVIPSVSALGERIPLEQLELPQGLKQEVQDYLDDRRLLTSVLVITEPVYVWVSVEARVRIKAKVDADQVRDVMRDTLASL